MAYQDLDFSGYGTFGAGLGQSLGTLADLGGITPRARARSEIEKRWKGNSQSNTQSKPLGSLLQPEAAPEGFTSLGDLGNPRPLGGAYFDRLGQIESNNNPNAVNKQSGASGQFQFMPATAKQYGLANPMDPVASRQAVEKFTSDNANTLRKGLGREPNEWELYLAHQQGAGGALRLLKNPDTLAARLVGPKAVVQNGGDPNMTAAQFASLWQGKFSGGQDGSAPMQQPASMASPGQSQPMQAEAGAQQMGPSTEDLQYILTNPYATDGDKKLAAMYLEQRMPKAKEFGFMSDGNGGVYATNARTGSVDVAVPGNGPKPNYDIITNAKTGEIVRVDKNHPDSVTILRPGNAQAGGMGADELSGLRKEIYSLPSYKNMTQAIPIYQSMIETSGRDSKASDLNLVYGLGKIMDPTSVVREGEMVMVKNTSALPDWLVGTINSINGGAAITQETRRAIMAEAKSRMQSYQGAFDNDLKMYRGIVDRNHVNPADVIPDFGNTPTAQIAAGVIEDGYRFKGGDPSDQNNWEAL